MRLDNSAFTKYRFCPLAYFERYEADAMPLVQLGNDTRGILAATPNDALALDEQAPGPKGIVPTAPAPDRDFGSRFHQLVANARRGHAGLPLVVYPDWPDEDIELECRAIWAQYQAHYAT